MKKELLLSLQETREQHTTKLLYLRERERVFLTLLPTLSVAVEPKTKGDQDKMSIALIKLAQVGLVMIRFEYALVDADRTCLIYQCTAIGGSFVLLSA